MPAARLNRRSLFEETENKVIYLKKHKYNTIFQYIIDMKKKWNLNLLQAQALLSYILLAFLLKFLKSSDMIFKDNKIISINGINFKNSEIIYENNLLKNFKVQSLEIINTKKLSDLWIKFLEKN